MAAASNSVAFAWLAYYFAVNLAITIYNKSVMHFLHFSYPWILTGIHSLGSLAGCVILARTGAFTPKRLSTRDNLVMFAFSLLYTVNIAVSNLSLHAVTVPIHQVVRSSTPFFMILINIIWLAKYPSRPRFLSIVPTLLGVALATYGDYYATPWGLFLTLLGVVLSALKGVATNQVLVGPLKLHPLDLLLKMSPLALAQCLVCAVAAGEWQEYRDNFLWTRFAVVAIVGNGAVAFAMNYVSFTANKMTSAVTMGVAANVKQALSIVLSVWLFDLAVNATNVLGILITLGGGAWYTRVEFQERSAVQKLTDTPSSPKRALSSPGVAKSPVVVPRERSPGRNHSDHKDVVVEFGTGGGGPGNGHAY
ncbi:TPT-domain-containing protein [Gonapodya prolifera JEL478]|uniref:TPT-domain-containing protein n=1 Tax=Gonapodya prolifera (strain JEL478) TaxID=1344416 RepID=A0A139AB35_GONPJ|nr:TPT-domain-containing protein [Gonapodya prolifera JEL478]|eukprot:KXS13603.1 TPT-domain-containing protein [Gonapodya prolifera JEL478]